MKSLIGALALCVGLFGNVAQATTADDIKTLNLKNGMKILVLEDHSIPNANMYIFWRVGSRNEYPGITGLSHFFEHMMFNGSKNYGPKMFDRVMEAAGGANNAYTTKDMTVYTDWFPAEGLETIFKLESDRIAHLAIDPKMVQSERGVVSSERRTGLENSNYRAIAQEVDGAAFRAHPYSWPVVGHQSDIDNWSQQDLERYYKTYYAPNNAVVVIAGDVSLDAVKKLSNRYFAPIAAQTPPRKVHTVEPEQKGERRVYRYKASVSTPNIMMAFHTPAADHPDFYALSVLRDILTGGKSSRMYVNLVDKQLATNIYGDMSESLNPYLFILYGIAANVVPADQLEKAMIGQIDDIIKNGVSEKELQKAKNNKIVDFYRTMNTIDGKANTIGSYETFYGDYHKLFSATDEYNKLTVADIQRVAKTYLKKANRTVGILSNKEDSNEADL